MVEIVDGALIKDEMTKNARGGTELIAGRILAHVDPEALDNVQIVFSRPNNLLDGYFKVLYLHDLPEDPAIAAFADPAWRAQFNLIVFVSHYQRMRFARHFNCLMTDNMVVIQNAIDPIREHYKPDDKIRLIYHTTPHRGLHLLTPVFFHLAKEYPGALELKVFSSFDIYGWGERDQQYDRVFKMLQDHPDVVYSKSVPNDVIRRELTQAHIFAFPSIWEETSCLALMEAMSANLLCIHSSYGALPETSHGMNAMYAYVDDWQVHADAIYQSLKFQLETHFLDKAPLNTTLDSKRVVDRFYNLNSFAELWNANLRLMKDNGYRYKKESTAQEG